VPVPLAGVSIEAEIRSFYARVVVAQHYVNHETPAGMRELILLQAADGSWELTEELALSSSTVSMSCASQFEAPRGRRTTFSERGLRCWRFAAGGAAPFTATRESALHLACTLH
jgi:hypothetical protein